MIVQVLLQVIIIAISGVILNINRQKHYEEKKNNIIVNNADNYANNNITDLTSIFPSNSSGSSNNDGSPYLCRFCDVALIRKMDDPGDKKRFICPRCANIEDPLKVDEFNKIKHSERGQTIRSSSSSSSSEDRPFAEMFNSNTTTDDKEGSLKGTQLSRALQKTDIINSNNDDPEPNEDSIMRGQNNMKILRTETTYPESGRKVVKTFDDDY